MQFSRSVILPLSSRCATGLRRRLIQGLGLAIAAGGVLVYGVLPWWVADRVTRHRFEYPDKENAGLTPGSFGLASEDVKFAAPDGVPLSGWWVPAQQPHGTVVLVHGLNRTRIEMARKLPFVHGHGWNALLFDLRRHGRSGGDVTTFGLREKDDVLAAAALARQRCTGPVVLWGVSLGAASAMLASAQDPEIAGVVCDSSYRSLPDTVAHHVGLVKFLKPQALLARAALFWVRRSTGVDPAAVDVEQAAARLRGRPALFVCASGDRRMPPAIARDLAARAGAGAQLLEVASRRHGGAWREGESAYAAAVERLLAQVAAQHPDRG